MKLSLLLSMELEPYVWRNRARWGFADWKSLKWGIWERWKKGGGIFEAKQ